MVTLILEGVGVEGDEGGRRLDGLDLTFPSGSLTALMGPTGAGATTVLRVLAGTQYPDRGRVWFEDMDVTVQRPDQRDVAVVDQTATVFPHRTVAGNVEAALEASGLPADEIALRAASELRAVGLESRADAPPGRLSAGGRRRLAIARATVRRPRAFLFDEPFGELDPGEAARLRSQLRELHDALRTTTVIATHEPEHALALGDQLVVLDGGRVLQVGDPSSCYARPATTLVAELMAPRGLAFIDGFVEGDGLRLGDAPRAQLLPLRPHARGAVGASRMVTLGIRREALSVAVSSHRTEERPTEERPRLVASVVSVRGMGAGREGIARLEPGGPEVAFSPGAEQLTGGQGVLLSVDPDKLLYFDVEGRLLHAGR
ncbi:ABC transporter ATP-binding protein [Egibacter rhizosphaerae]|uniref:ABC transporter ATP-binding protein n=1 Tax=Egibacter rhizosphaerae TaxID=1670831 RepID=A0A411YKJ9_9ACTN|nr:ABC transporter ATP-binding protein [Egibacter rhizosphaerae]QBI21739.1 ABC transporter ATP-binding protein [Egibacter rhizosphaerae]